jgi:hypothetical protein
MNTCPDAEGNPTGLANVSALANDVNEQCSNNTFIITGTAEPCNDDGTPISGERDLLAFIGNIEYYQTIQPDLKGLFMVDTSGLNSELPPTIASALAQALI